MGTKGAHLVTKESSLQFRVNDGVCRIYLEDWFEDCGALSQPRRSPQMARLLGHQRIGSVRHSETRTLKTGVYERCGCRRAPNQSSQPANEAWYVLLRVSSPSLTALKVGFPLIFSGTEPKGKVCNPLADCAFDLAQRRWQSIPTGTLRQPPTRQTSK